ncbi:MAG: AAA family ATPase [Candidatus Binatia bacterium]
MTKNTIWDFVNLTTDSKEPSDRPPYASTSGKNYLEQYVNATRHSTKREHAINHCFEMARYFYSTGRHAEGCDWVVAAAAHADNEAEVLPRLLAAWGELSSEEIPGWPTLLLKPPVPLGARLTAITILRLLETASNILSRESNARFLSFLQRELPDIWGHLGINKDTTEYQQLDLIKRLTLRLEESLQAVAVAASAGDLDSVLLRRHHITQALHHKLVAGILAPHLPRGFAKTTIPAVFTCVEELIASQDTRFVELTNRARQEIANALSQLSGMQTFYAAKFVLPLIEHVRALVDARFESSDATKPASLSVEPYPRKYPFHAKGKSCRLRFELDNRGPGPATDVEMTFIFLADLEPLEVHRTFSELEVDKYLIDLDVEIREVITAPVEFEVQCSWRNYDASQGTTVARGHLGLQNPNVDWDTLVHEEPYSMEAIHIDSTRPFIGRETDLSQLVRAFGSKSMGSAYIHGQKRVGKTSLALAGAKRLQEDVSGAFAIYLEGGDYVQPTAESTLHAMGISIARKVRACDRALERLPLPDIGDSLSPLNQYMDEVLDVLPKSRWLLILDEFDELPLELFKRGPVGDALFLTLRALSGRPRVGIVLIGGEKMNSIIASQGDQLNRFEAIRVDYFRKGDHWTDFQDLVRKPVSAAIEYSDSAIEEIYHWSHGNPFFTNMVCKEVLAHCYDRRDAFVSDLEVKESANRACSKAGANSFQHFWEDGVLDTGPNVEEVSIRRRKVLLALAATLRIGLVASREHLARQTDLLSVSTASLDRELKQFVERGVLTERNGEYSCRVFMFEQFLRERSAQLISTEFTDQDERTRHEREENEAYVTAAELIDLVENWGVFVGKNITPEYVRAWLDQFESNTDKRLMFQLLKAAKFYSEAAVRQKLREAMDVVGRRTIAVTRGPKYHRSDLLVTHLGGIAKSGSQFARMFCQENDILIRNAVGYEELATRLRHMGEDIRGIVIADDIIGTGDSAIEALKELDKHVGDLVRAKGYPIIVIAVCGFDDARKKVEEAVKLIDLPVKLHVCDILYESDRAFSSASVAFANDRERHRAKEIAREKGEELEKKWPFGYGDCQGLVVFFGNCPNSTLPILRKNAKDWRALFPRL